MLKNKCSVDKELSLDSQNSEPLKFLVVTSYTAGKCKQVQEYVTMIGTGHS